MLAGCSLGYFHPYMDKTAFRLEMLSEACILLLNYHLMIFAGWMPQEWMREAFGWSYIGIVCLYFLIHVVFLAIKVVRDVIHAVRKKIYLYKQKQIMLNFIKEMS